MFRLVASDEIVAVGDTIKVQGLDYVIGEIVGSNIISDLGGHYVTYTDTVDSVVRTWDEYQDGGSAYRNEVGVNDSIYTLKRFADSQCDKNKYTDALTVCIKILSEYNEDEPASEKAIIDCVKRFFTNEEES